MPLDDASPLYRSVAECPQNGRGYWVNTSDNLRIRLAHWAAKDPRGTVFLFPGRTEYVEKYGKYYMTRWKELGNRPALQFYNEAITTAPESEAARIAEKKVAQLRGNEN